MTESNPYDTPRTELPTDRGRYGIRAGLRAVSRAARGAARLGLVVAFNVFGVFAFAGALYQAPDLWKTGTVVAGIVGCLAWLLDTLWSLVQLAIRTRGAPMSY